MGSVNDHCDRWTVLLLVLSVLAYRRQLLGTSMETGFMQAVKILLSCTLHNLWVLDSSSCLDHTAECQGLSSQHPPAELVPLP